MLGKKDGLQILDVIGLGGSFVPAEEEDNDDGGDSADSEPSENGPRRLV